MLLVGAAKPIKSAVVEVPGREVGIIVLAKLLILGTISTEVHPYWSTPTIVQVSCMEIVQTNMLKHVSIW